MGCAKSNITGYGNTVNVNDMLQKTKLILGQDVPYTARYDGTITFTDRFTTAAKQAMTEDCIAMTREERVVFFDWISYQNGLPPLDRTTSDTILEALDVWMLDEWMNIPHPNVDKCYEEYTLTNKGGL